MIVYKITCCLCKIVFQLVRTQEWVEIPDFILDKDIGLHVLASGVSLILVRLK